MGLVKLFFLALVIVQLTTITAAPKKDVSSIVSANIKGRGKASQKNKHMNSGTFKKGRGKGPKGKNQGQVNEAVEITSVSATHVDVSVSWESTGESSYLVQLKHPFNDTMNQETQTNELIATFIVPSTECPVNYTVTVTPILEDESLGKSFSSYFMAELEAKYIVSEVNSSFVLYYGQLVDSDPAKHCQLDCLTTYSPNTVEEAVALSDIGKALIDGSSEYGGAYASGLFYLDGSWVWTLTNLTQTSAKGQDGWEYDEPVASSTFPCGRIVRSGYFAEKCYYEYPQVCLLISN